MGRRGENAFKRNDAVRALRSAADAGLAVTMMEIITKDGTTFRIYGDKAAMDTTQDTAGAKVWDAEIAKLKAKGGNGQ
jgi:hypothetical protein